MNKIIAFPYQASDVVSETPPNSPIAEENERLLEEEFEAVIQERHSWYSRYYTYRGTYFDPRAARG